MTMVLGESVVSCPDVRSQGWKEGFLDLEL